MESPSPLTSVGLTTANARTLLAPSAAANGLADGVARRLGSAIRLGLLIDGERLPSESDLSVQLGVSTVTLREALGTLRQKGLVVTRRGRGGGTFVCAPRDAREPLAQFGVHELQELADQRAAISGAAAQLAAQRATEDELRRLDEQVERLSAAGTASDRRRADSQLMIGIAAAAQSSRLAREEARLRNEIGDLLRIEQTDVEHAAIVRDRKRLIDAVRKREAETARQIAEAQVYAETERLIRLRLDMVAPAAPTDSRRAGKAVLEQVVAEFEGIFADLDALARQVAGLGGGAERMLLTTDLASRRPSIISILSSRGDLVSGAGVVVEPGQLEDAERWLEWWSTNTVGGRPEPFRANLDPRAPDFYDYTTTDWFATPKRTLKPRMAGPFVDYACTNKYTCTLAVPIVRAGEFLGVAAADVLVSSLERRVLPKLVGLSRRVAVTTEDHRVVVSNDPSVVTGRRLDHGQARTAVTAGRPPVGNLRLVTV